VQAVYLKKLLDAAIDAAVTHPAIPDWSEERRNLARSDEEEE
jgi:hypothetical protein